MPPDLAVTLPYWLDRPAGEALDIARHAESAGVTEPSPPPARGCGWWWGLYR